jgi:hypothetical protein
LIPQHDAAPSGAGSATLVFRFMGKNVVQLASSR